MKDLEGIMSRVAGMALVGALEGLERGLEGSVADKEASGGMKGRMALLSKDWTKRLVSVVQATYEVTSILENTPGLNARKAEKIVSTHFDLSQWGEVDWNEFVKAF